MTHPTDPVAAMRAECANALRRRASSLHLSKQHNAALEAAKCADLIETIPLPACATGDDAAHGEGAKPVVWEDWPTCPACGSDDPAKLVRPCFRDGPNGTMGCHGFHFPEMNPAKRGGVDGPYSEAVRIAELMLDPENAPPQYGMNDGWRLFTDALARARATPAPSRPADDAGHERKGENRG